MYVRKRKEQFPQMNWRPSPEDRKIMSDLSAKLGVQTSDVIRLGIRLLARREAAQDQQSKAAD